jgi:hypothetical protein
VFQWVFILMLSQASCQISVVICWKKQQFASCFPSAAHPFESCRVQKVKSVREK